MSPNDKLKLKDLMFENFIDIDALIEEHCPFGEVGNPVFKWKNEDHMIVENES